MMGTMSVISNKHLRILNDFIDYFNVSKYTLLDKESENIEKLKNLKGCLKTDDIEKSDFVYVKGENLNEEYIKLQSRQKNNSVFVIETPYKNIKK